MQSLASTFNYGPLINLNLTQNPILEHTDRHKGTLLQTTGTAAAGSVYSLIDTASAAAASPRPPAKNTLRRPLSVWGKKAGRVSGFGKVLHRCCTFLRSSYSASDANVANS